ncbi:conserved hypothetical protein [Flavobacterium sp. 9AF]|uniref:GLPGLI family protein n=1 Tax=Flavobacterium sp. 9AF TaxID=2653142 RepID=UPI0012F0D5EB|nr:GLPGLI family protein [Flavobacterium sp. 9AF]VXB14206.1 conserved hypothetical protein [Flavobacterium sp. 9AF]
MKKILFVFLILYVYKIQSQNFIAKGKVDYDMYSNTDGLKNYNAILYFNENYSKFVFNVKGLAQNVIETTKDDASQHLEVVIRDTTETAIIHSVKEKKLYILNQKVNVWEESGSQEWILEEEVKEIGSLLCSKATCKFRGRNYTAWYAPAIPLPYGPWKFNGLPGLIIELYDHNKDVYFSMLQLKIPFNQEIEGLKGNENFITRKELKIIDEENNKKFIKRMNEKAQRMQASSGKDETIKISISPSIEKKGIELD